MVDISCICSCLCLSLIHFAHQLAGSDTNKNAIVEKGGMGRLIKLSARFSDDPSVLQEVSKNLSLCDLCTNYISGRHI